MTVPWIISGESTFILMIFSRPLLSFTMESLTNKVTYGYPLRTLGVARMKIYNNPQINSGKLQAAFYQFNEPNVDPVYKNNFYSFAQDPSGNVWTIGYNNQLYCFDEEHRQFVPVSIRHPLTNQFVNQRKNLLIDRDGDFLISIEQIGLLVWSRGNDDFTLYQASDKGQHNPRGSVLFAMAQDQNGMIWIGDRNAEGLSLFDKKMGTFTYCQSQELDPYSLNSNKINYITEDREGNVWVGSIVGLNKYSPGKSKFKRFYSNPNIENRLSHNNTLCFEESSQGHIWIGTDGGGLNKYDRKTGLFTSYKHESGNPQSLSSDAIISLHEDHEGTLWIATFNGGLCQFKNNRFTTYSPIQGDPYSISNINIWYVFEDSKQNLWVGTLNSGLELFDRTNKRFYHYSNHLDDPSSLCNNSIVSIYEDSQQKLYISTYNGVSVIDLNAYDFKKGRPDLRFYNILHHPNQNSLSSNEVFCVREDLNGDLWFGTMATGIDHLNRKNGKFTNYTTDNGLAGNSVSAILVDGSNHLWLGTDKGLARFNPQTGKSDIFDQMDGLQNNSLKSWAIKTSDGEMYFGGPNGFNTFYPDQFTHSQNLHVPTVTITGLRIFNKPVKINEHINERIILTNDISETKELVLTHRENYFTFEFVALDFRTPEKNNYAYKMEGFDDDWVMSGNRREANYTNLDPGQYTFRVKGSNNDGLWNETGTSLKLTILPPWWESLIFRIGSAFFIILTVTLLVWYRFQSIKKQKIVLERMVTEKTAELQQMNQELNELNATKDKFFSIIAHDIKSPFNAIVGFSELLKDNFFVWSEEMKISSVQRIHKASVNLYYLLENLLQWSRTQRGKIEFHPEKIRISKALQDLSDLMNEQAAAKNIRVIVEVNEKNLTAMADRLMLDTILRNLLSNAIKFSHPDGKVHLSAKRENNSVKIEVIDEGTGIPEPLQQRLIDTKTYKSTPGTRNEKGTGLGLILVNDFIARHQGKLGLESKPGKGTRFFFTIPLA
jgi:signal transduction histidine kinase/ligand-binding sensor domain-containing protein